MKEVELEHDPQGVLVSEVYPDHVLVCVGRIILPAPNGYEGAEYLEYEVGDRVPKAKVTLAELYAYEQRLTLLRTNGFKGDSPGVDPRKLSSKAQTKISRTARGEPHRTFDSSEYDGESPTSEEIQAEALAR